MTNVILKRRANAEDLQVAPTLSDGSSGRLGEEEIVRVKPRDGFRHCESVMMNLAVSSILAVAVVGTAAAATIEVGNWTVTAPDDPDPALPNVLLFGDSILGGYGPQFRTLAEGRANVYTWNMIFLSSPGARNVPTNAINTVSALANFSRVVFNNGLHSYEWNEASVSDDDVHSSYAALAATLRTANPNAQLYYLATTPHTGDKTNGVVSTYGEYNPVMQRLNRFAQSAMADAGIPYLDAYALLAPRLDLANGDHFHWTTDAYVKIARLVASALGWYAPEDPAVTTVPSAVSKTDYCSYRHRNTMTTVGSFGDIELYAGQGPGTPSALYASFFYAGFPTAPSAAATVKLPVWTTSTALDVNVDLWALGWQSSPATLPNDADLLADEDATAWLNGRTPVKLADNLVPANTSVNGTLTADASAAVVLQMNRAAVTNGWTVLRINPDGVPTGETGMGRHHTFKDANRHSDNPSRIDYTQYADPIAPALRSFSEGLRAGKAYACGTGVWAQGVTAAGVQAPVFVPVCGRTGGADANVILRLPVPNSIGRGVTRAALNVAVAPTGAAKMTVPAGVGVDVWALGIETVEANVDPAFPANPFLTGTADARTLLNDTPPVRLGTLVAGGTVLVPGSTLTGDSNVATNLATYLTQRLGTEAYAGDAKRYLVVRLNATAPSAAAAADWGFGVGSITAAPVVSTLEICGDFVQTTLPAAVDGVITLAADTEYNLTETNAVPEDVTKIVVSSGATLTYDIPAGTNFILAAALSGTGTFVKRGVGAFTFANGTGGESGTNYGGVYTVSRIRVEAGELHLPTFAYTDFVLKDVYVAAGAVVYLAGSDEKESVRTEFLNLCGEGRLTNGWSKAQTLQQNQNTTTTNFAGRIDGNIASVWIYPNAKTVLTGTNSTFYGTGNGLPGFGSLSVTKIGYNASSDSSIGHNGEIRLTPNDGGNSTFAFLGTEGETTVKTLSYAPRQASASTCRTILDAGLGGLVWNGNWSFGGYAMVCAILQGDGAKTNVMGGAITETSGSTYLEKRGEGTWFLKPTSSAHKGVTAVTGGKLLFETLREKGTACSLGLSTLTHEAYVGGCDATKAVNYAFLLKNGATLECVGKDGSSEANVAVSRPLVLAGAGRLATTCAESFKLAGVSSIATAPVTLTLDGSNSDSTLQTVTDGTSALSLVKEGPGTWTLDGEQSFSGSLAVNAGTLVVNGGGVPYTWYKYVIKTMNSYYSKNDDSCRVTHEFALYDAEPVPQNVGLEVTTAQATELQPGQATVVEASARNYSGGSWAFTSTGLYLPNMFDDNAGTASYLAGPGNGTNEACWISIAMRPTNGTPPIVACDLVSSGGNWNSGTRRVAAWSVSGSDDGRTWTELTNQTTNETARFTSGWYSDGTSFAKGAIRKLSDGHGIAIDPLSPVVVPSPLANVSTVSVAEGATLRAYGAVTLRNLSAPYGGACGTIDGFTVAPTGTLYLNGTSRSATQPLGFTFENLKDGANFRNWTVCVNGKPAPRYRLSLRGKTLSVSSGYTCIIIR